MRNAASLAAGSAVIAVLAAGVFIFVGCGGSEGNIPNAPTETTAPVTETPTAAPVTESPTAAPPPTQSRATSTPEPATRATNTPEPSPATTAQPDETPATATATATATERPSKPATSAGGARADGPADETDGPSRKPGATPGPVSKTTGGGENTAASPEGPEYTWRDGDRVQRVYLETALVVQPSTENTDDDIVARDDGEASIVQKQPRHDEADTDPVFRSQAGDLMTLPGGVLLALDAEWDQARVNRFFSDHGIDRSRVQERDFSTNAFFVESEPGFPSLNLANELAEQEGVLISSPNWRTEVSLR